MRSRVVAEMCVGGKLRVLAEPSEWPYREGPIMFAELLA
jgi:hypothetical protein